MVELAEDVSIAVRSIGLAGSPYSGDDIFKFSQQGIGSGEYRCLVVTLCDQLKKFLNLEESVQNSEDVGAFALDLAGFLREIKCPVASLMNVELDDRFLNVDISLALLDYLITELEAVRLIAKNNPEVLKKSASAVCPVNSGKNSAHIYWLQKLCKSLGFPKPPPNISPEELCGKIESRVEEVVASWPPDFLGKPLIQHQISTRQWDSLVALNEIFTEEYAIRREMLLTRLDVTVRSFGWGDRASKSGDIEKVYLPLREMMPFRTGLVVASLLAAREDLIRIRKTCDASLRERTKCAINKAKMGAVPDRGGRANEYDAPPPEMPQWQKRQTDSGGYRGGHGGGGGHHQQRGGSGSVFDRLDGGGGQQRPYTAGGGGYHQQQQQQGPPYFNQYGDYPQQQFHPQSNFDMYGNGGGGGGHRGGGRGGRGGQRY